MGNKEEYTDAKRIGEMFAADLIKYQKLGGNMANLTAYNVYSVINGNNEIDDLSKINDIVSKMESSDIKESNNLIDKYHNEIKNKLEPYIYNLLFRIIGTKKQNFDSLTKNQKIKFITEGYKYNISSENQKLN